MSSPIRRWLDRLIQFYGVGAILVTPPAVCLGLLGVLLRSSTKYMWARWVLGMYLMWAWVIDRRTPTHGGRLIPAMRAARIWNLVRSYFPCRLIKQSAEEPDPSKAYVIGLHPHGIFAVSSFCNVITHPAAFPGLDFRLVTVSANFKIPFWRDILMGLGLVDADRESCARLLKNGTSVAIVVGGAAESLDARPGTNDLTLGRRLGFVRIAIEQGCDLIPVFSFGENDLYKQIVPNPPGSTAREVQNRIMSLFGYTIPLVAGRTDGFGVVPYRTPLLTVIGKPVPVPHIPNPSVDDILEVHERYVTALQTLYNEFRHMAGETIELNVGCGPREHEIASIRKDLEKERERKMDTHARTALQPDSSSFRFRYYGLPDEYVSARGEPQAVGYEPVEDMTAAAAAAAGFNAVESKGSSTSPGGVTADVTDSGGDTIESTSTSTSTSSSSVAGDEALMRLEGAGRVPYDGEKGAAATTTTTTTTATAAAVAAPDGTNDGSSDSNDTMIGNDRNSSSSRSSSRNDREIGDGRLSLSFDQEDLHNKSHSSGALDRGPPTLSNARDGDVKEQSESPLTSSSVSSSSSSPGGSANGSSGHVSGGNGSIQRQSRVRILASPTGDIQAIIQSTDDDIAGTSSFSSSSSSSASSASSGPRQWDRLSRWEDPTRRARL